MEFLVMMMVVAIMVTVMIVMMYDVEEMYCIENEEIAYLDLESTLT